MFRKNIRSQKGTQSAELAAVLAIFFPIVVLCAVAASEASQVYEIINVLNQTASSAARRLAIAYMANPASTMANPNSILSQITCLNIVQSPQQFSSPTSNTGWNMSSYPPTVTVVVSFKSGQYGCPVFPNPDPLQIGNNLTLTATASAPLQ